MSVRHRIFVALAAIALVVCWSVTEACVTETGLLYLAPAVLLVLPLLFGRYVGEERIAALAAAPVAAGRRRACSVALPQLSGGPIMHRGGRLVASSMAKRPPPACAQLSLL